MEVQLVQVVAAAVQVGGPTLNRLLGDAVSAGGRLNRINSTFAEVLVDAARLVEEPKGGLESMDDVPALRLVEAFVIQAADAVHEAHVPRLRQERVVIDEAPERQQTVYAAGFFVITEDARHLQ